ncbi:hypothetical protein AMAG_03001 [Allomyces macrogynus ATCC 38327]|uniref:Uncharacterized protein n=1 Tax=Allomyces macrogynus (strain ATCC 38327) TaxID=578462 RepID=A0A0L0S3Z1_ALLM3|nr:hypothetical protein AMAG_03001 [Allomyces macrogynus ATCC 38327]|eukprot:KNE57268.1 hypothetical protein AMAG_03001 [Allomyces macrogynus ATCC 38327]
MTGESRQDLLNWVNSLLGLNIVKIEEMGKGFALCQIFDSIFLDVPLKKVKFNARHEFEYIQNFKVLQSVFDKHKIPNDIPVERLVKLKFQDNIEFLQFVKKFWDTHFPGGYYDAAGRRSGAGATVATGAPKPTRSPVSSAGRVSSPLNAGRPRSSLGSNNGASAAALQQAQMQVAELTAQVEEAQAALDAMGKERDFYFGKLRQVEVALQALQEQGQEFAAVKDILGVLYAQDAEPVPMHDDMAYHDGAAMEETF